MLYGTQRLEETLGSHFADTPIIRIDRDTTRRKKAFDRSCLPMTGSWVVYIANCCD
jgi:primosomal protein N'